MEFKQLFQKFRKRMTIESVIKSLIYAFILGFSVAFVISFILWFTVPKFWWIGIIVGFAVVAACAPVFYFKIFRPTDKDVARRIDRLGLNERAITMLEYENEDSFIAECLKKSTSSAVDKVSPGLLSFIVPNIAIIAVSVTGVLGIGMTTVTGLSAAGVIETGKEVVDNIVNPPDRFEVEFRILGVVSQDVSGNYIGEEDVGGFLDGDIFQLVEEGEYTQPVQAEAETADDFMFVGWVNTSQEFTGWNVSEWLVGKDLVDGFVYGETQVTGNTFVYAIFQKLGDAEPGDGDSVPGEGEGEGDEDGADDVPPEEGDGEGEGDANDGDSSNSGGGSYVQGGNVIDGETYYGDVFDLYYEKAMEYIESNDLPDDLRELIEAYFNGLKP